MKNRYIALAAAAVLIGVLAVVAVRIVTRDARDAGFFTDRSKALARLTTKEAEEGAIRKLEDEIARSPGTETAAAGYLDLGAIYERRGDLPKAKECYRTFVEKFPSSPRIAEAHAALDDVSVRLIFSPAPTPDSTVYEVVKGDTLTRIARKFNTTVDLIARANDIKRNAIRIGQKLKVQSAVPSIVVVRSQNILILKMGDEIVKTYRVATGKDNTTPVGIFTIVNKAVNPVWYTTGAVVPPDSPENILGTRWMGISVPHYGIHGTTEPESIGQSVTAGCVRMKNEDVEELYTIVPVGTQVMILE